MTDLLDTLCLSGAIALPLFPAALTVLTVSRLPRGGERGVAVVRATIMSLTLLLFVATFGVLATSGEASTPTYRTNALRLAVAQGHGLVVTEIRRVRTDEEGGRRRVRALVRLESGEVCELLRLGDGAPRLTCGGALLPLGTEAQVDAATARAEVLGEEALDAVELSTTSRVLAALALLAALLLLLVLGLSLALTVHLRRAGPTSPLPRAPREVARTTALTGWKVATPIWHEVEGGALQGITAGSHARFSADEEAVCTRGRATHQPPERGCTCGFHAWSTPQTAMGTWSAYSAALLLEVRLLGRYQLHARGARAGRQRVVAALLGDCAGCDGQASTLVVDEDSRTSHGVGWHVLRPSCSQCVLERTEVSPERLAASLDPTGRLRVSPLRLALPQASVPTAAVTPATPATPAAATSSPALLGQS